MEIPLEELIGTAGRLELNPEIESRDYFAVHLSKGALCLCARGYVGQIPLNRRIVVDVRPRVPVTNLPHMVRVSGAQPTMLSSFRSYATGGEWDDSLLDLYADGLVEHVQRIAQAGFLREYHRSEARSSFPRGRIAVHRTIQDLSAGGIEHAAHVSWFERSRDNGPNRCLKYATWTLARRYQRLDGRNRQVEGYIRNVLRRHATGEQWPAGGPRRQRRGENGPLRRAGLARGDAGHRDCSPDGATPLVLDVKNVPVDEQPARESINQAVTHALCYRAPAVVLVHPRGSRLQQPGMAKLGDIGQVAVFRYRLDAGAESLLEEEERFSAAVGELVPVSPAG